MLFVHGRVISETSQIRMEILGKGREVEKSALQLKIAFKLALRDVYGVCPSAHGFRELLLFFALIQLLRNPSRVLLELCFPKHKRCFQAS